MMEKQTHKRWSEEEDDFLYEEVTNNFSNIQATFKRLSPILNRTVAALHQRWYDVLTNPEHPKYKGSICFLTMGKKEFLPNRKINSGMLLEQTPPNLWDKIIEYCIITRAKIMDFIKKHEKLK